MSTSRPPNPAIRNQDMLALRNFVTAQDGPTNASILALNLTHSNLQQRHLEARFALDSTLYDLRLRFYQTTGTPPRDQLLQIFDHEQALQPMVEIPADMYIDTDDRLPLLSFFHAGVRARVHCIDINPLSTSAGGALENVSLVPKFRLSDEEYDKRENTLRAWSRRQKAQDPAFTLERHAVEQREVLQARMCQKRGLPLPAGFQVDTTTGQVIRAAAQVREEEPDPAVQYNENSVGHAIFESRCEVMPGGRRGVVRWTGQLTGKPGWWIGVELDEPVGQNDGGLDGIRYFSVAKHRGCFVRGPNLNVGPEFTERDLFDESDSEDEL